MSTTAAARPHIVVLGAGFGGLTFAKKFPDGLARVTIVDRTNHHLFQPLLYQVAAAGLAVPDIAQPVRSILAKKRDITVLMNEATAIDLAARRVDFRDASLEYDYLVLALGGCTSYFGHPEWEEIAPGLKSIDDAIRIRREVLGAFERAEMSDDPAERERLMTIVVVGGGATGVELAGTFAELQRHVLSCDFRRLHLEQAKVILIEGGDRILDAYSPKLSEKARQQLESLGVKLLLKTRVQDIKPGEVHTANGIIRAGTIIWGAGVQSVGLTRTLGIETDRAGRLKVLPDLSLPGHPEVFAVGDIVTLVDAKKQTVPGVAPAAMQMAQYVVRLLRREITAAQTSGAPALPDNSATVREPFAYRDKGMMATIGRSRAVARSGPFEFSGMPAWLMWLGIHLIFLVGFRNKLSVLFQWIYSYATYKRGARVIYGFGERDPGRHPPAPRDEAK